jgi:hypothetical protein
MNKSNMSQRKIDGYLKLAEIIQFGRKNPVDFVSRFLGIELLDFQKWAFEQSWTRPYVVWCMGRNSGKSTLAAPFIMAKTILIPNFQVYIMSGTGSQAQDTFLKIEKIAKKEIQSFTGLTDIFFNETVKSAANTDGFTHSPASFKTYLYNGSAVHSLNGAFDNIRGKRSNLNLYDEAGFISEELFTATEPFLTQNSSFKLGGKVDVSLEPKSFPNQRIFASSASTTDSYFFKKYSEYSKRMIMGDKDYFVADISSDIVVNATYNGKLYPVPLLSQDTIDAKMRENPEKGMREYKNIFTSEGSDKQIVKRATIIHNSEVYPPILANQGGQKFVFAIDPARTNDNAICSIGEIYEDPDVGYKMRIVNCVCWSDSKNKFKRPISSPDQQKDFKRMLLAYNGNRSAEYENVMQVLIDSGAGGGGVSSWADNLLEDWTDETGHKHRGFIDLEYGSIGNKTYEPYASKYPNADRDTIKLIAPGKFKVELFDSLIEMTKLNLITFPSEYDSKGKLSIMKEKSKKNEQTGKVEKLAEVEEYSLTQDEIMSLIQIDLAKEELVNMYGTKNGNGSISYDLAPEKKNKMHDDRAYTFAMLAWYLKQLRRKNITDKPKISIDVNKFFMVKKPKII